MQEYYAKKNQPAPYTTLAGFRRARRAQAESYKAVAKTIADASKYGEKLPRPKGNNQSIINSSGYEHKYGQIVSSNISRRVTVAAREILRENNRANEETAIAFSLSGERILKQHSKGLFISIDMEIVRRQPKDSVVLVHNHPQNDSFSDRDLRFMQNKQIHTIIASCHDGKIFSLRTNCGKRVDEYIVSEYNSIIEQENLTRNEALAFLSKKYGWEYKEL